MTEFAVTFLPVAAAAFLGYRLGIYRDRRARRSDATIQFLLTAYQQLEFGGNRPNIPNKDEFEKAIASIFLLGNRRQVELVRAFMSEFARNGHGADTTELLKALRAELRKELQLDAVKNEFMFLRLGRTEREIEKMYE